MILQELQAALQSPTKASRGITVIVQVNNALGLQSEVAFVSLISSWCSVGCLVTDLRVDCQAWLCHLRFPN